MASETRSIFLATPCYAGLAHALFMRGVLALGPALSARRIGLHVELGGGEALIGRARAAMLAKFLASGASHLLFVDADVGFAPAAVFRLLDSGNDVVGGAYPKKTQPPGAAVAYEFEPLPGAHPTAASQIQAADAGAGFLMISRKAARRIANAYPRLKARLGDMHELGVAEAAMVFDSFPDPETGRYLSDHQAFCHRWRALGGEVWVDLGCELSHVGAVMYVAGELKS